MSQRLIGEGECCHCGKVVLKYLMFLFNVLIMLSGVALLGFGIFLRVKDGMSNAAGAGLSLNAYYNGCYMLMGFGGIMSLMGCFGCFGAIKENTCLLKLFVGILTCIILAEIGLAIYVGVDHDEVQQQVKQSWNTTLSDNGTANGFTKAIEGLQQELKCCGLLNGCTDWVGGVTHNCGCTPDAKNNGSCVAVEKTKCTTGDVRDKYIYTDSCYNNVVSYVEANIGILLGICGGVIAFEIAAVIVAICVHKHAEYSKYDALA